MGKVGRELTTEQGAEAAKAVMLNILATLKCEPVRRRRPAGDVHVARTTHRILPCPPLAAELGSLDKVKRIVKLTAFVNCVDSFAAQPKVANGASELLGQVFGDKGAHARSAVGTNSLPLNVPVEIEAIVEVV